MNPGRITVAIIATIAIALGVLMAPRAQRDRTAKLEFKSTDEMMQYLAGQAVEMADQNFGIKLDYTPGSIEKVEGILGKLHEEYVLTKPSDGLQGLSMAYGAYIGEVMKRSEPGAKWKRDDPVGGERSYPLIYRGGASYVCGWCYRRILNGNEDNVWFKYQAVKNESWKKPVGGPGGPTNGNQVNRSDTNGTSSATDPGR
jgi:hypothetical protein